MENLKELARDAFAKSLLGAIFMVGALAAWVAINVVVPPLEIWIKPPINDLEFTAERCINDDLIARVRLDKALYWGGTYAEYKGLILKFTTPEGKIIAWFDYFSDDLQPSESKSESKPDGLSTFRLLMIDACDAEFKAFTEHQSPYTYMRLKMNFGPFTGTPGTN